MGENRRGAPWWFVWLVAVVVGLALRAVSPPGLAEGPGGGHEPEVHYAFWSFIVFVAGLIWKGVEAAGRVTLEILKWVVINLSLVVTKVVNGLKVLGAGVLVGLKKAWEFFRLTYDKVLKPAWAKFWRWFDRLRKWLDDTFGPLLRFLRRLRDNLLLFYKTFVRPWLDLIDVTRRLLRVLSSLGLSWAHALDVKLGALEDKIERPFRLLLQKVNEVINIVNRVVTADGLFQRAAYIRTLARDYKYAWRAIANPYRKSIADAERALPELKYVDGLPDVLPGIRIYLRTGEGPDAAIIKAEVRRWKQYANVA